MEEEEALPEEEDFEREDRESLSESSPNKSSIGFFIGGISTSHTKVLGLGLGLFSTHNTLPSVAELPIEKGFGIVN
ncbi:hypothetical protein F2Q70_00034475 [Brassica cretica]|uniref:Uncharacterized protein n=1 Tax=Brassica cretica TaxID=69181 RepID=A0A8S9JPT8_BRACR|nr:hypothetical protein F2Q70_00034475 [Brassica cretica]